MKTNIQEEARKELQSILNYWITNTVDSLEGGFVARRDFNNNLDPLAAKGAILNARILWTFSASYRMDGNKINKLMADRAFKYINNFFVDREFGGVFWSLTPSGKMLDGKKQVYAQAFVIYALAEYYKITKKNEAKRLALEIFAKLEQYSLDREKGGYLEAFSREWNPIEDMRLSDKDRNDCKTMNTHLHVLEAYTNLYKIDSANESVRTALEYILNLYIDNFIDEDGHLMQFFDEDWNHTDQIVSYGHEIESAWLVVEAAEALGNDALIRKAEQASMQLTKAALEGRQPDGSLICEKDNKTGKVIDERHFWIEAEALVGYTMAYQISSDPKYISFIEQQWEFIQKYQKDRINGEWHLIVQNDHTPKPGEDKVGFWKCPYHNSRACLELISRFDKMDEHSFNTLDNDFFEN